MVDVPNIFLLSLKGQKTGHIPFWFMRQAGRYLPEYRALREKKKDFLEFCYTPELAAEATLQPIQRFNLDAAIIFSDILVVPHALGIPVRFQEGIGPILKPLENESDIKGLEPEKVKNRLEMVYQAIRLSKKQLASHTALIGFAGSPWTLACYCIEGTSSKNFAKTRMFSEENRDLFLQLLEILTLSVTDHALSQIEAGADAIQLFDSWAGMLPEKPFQDFVIAPTKKMVALIKAKYPHTPIIGFPRQAGVKFLPYVQETKVDAVNIDGSVSLEWARDVLQKHVIVQGNLNPMVLADNKAMMLKEAEAIIAALGDKPFVFNLGHGILPHTPVEHVQALCEFIRKKTH